MLTPVLEVKMKLYYCILTLHDNVFYATREMGILYETEKYLHNWALSYALFKGTIIPHPYRLQGEIAQSPDYLDESREQNLIYLNRRKIYVFPAQPLSWSYQINTFKAAQVNYYGRPQQFGDKGADRNYPINFGRAKELAVGSQYRTYIISAEPIEIPQWIRLGKWSAKVHVAATLIPNTAIEIKTGEYFCEHPLNPLDISPATELLLYNRIVMPPVSLVSQAQLRGAHWKLTEEAKKVFRKTLPHPPTDICLPTGVTYGARQLANT
jgi:CRISPR-associated protein Csc1